MKLILRFFRGLLVSVLSLGRYFSILYFYGILMNYILVPSCDDSRTAFSGTSVYADLAARLTQEFNEHDSVSSSASDDDGSNALEEFAGPVTHERHLSHLAWMFRSR
jgi:hypothetical protein